MNICFLKGKIIIDINFKFIVNNKKYYAISIFKIKLDNKSILTVKGYNETADWCYRNLIKNDNIAIYGNLNSAMEIIVQDIGVI